MPPLTPEELGIGHSGSGNGGGIAGTAPVPPPTWKAGAESVQQPVSKAQQGIRRTSLPACGQRPEDAQANVVAPGAVSKWPESGRRRSSTASSRKVQALRQELARAQLECAEEQQCVGELAAAKASLEAELCQERERRRVVQQELMEDEQEAATYGACCRDAVKLAEELHRSAKGWKAADDEAAEARQQAASAVNESRAVRAEAFAMRAQLAATSRVVDEEAHEEDIAEQHLLWELSELKAANESTSNDGRGHRARNYS